MLSAQKIVIVGDSHTDALKRALRTFPPEHVANIKAYRYATTKDGKTVGDLSVEEIAELVSTLGENDLAVSLIGGNQHQVVALMQHPTPFDMFDHESPPDNPDAEIIPYAQLQYFFDAGLRAKDGQRLEAIIAAARCKVAHCIPPPPKEDAAHIMRHHESHFANSGIAEKGVSPAPLRLKVWKVQGSVLARMSKEMGFELLWPPAQTLSDRGFLGTEYYANDATHGNTLYGQAVLAQLVHAANTKV